MNVGDIVTTSKPSQLSGKNRGIIIEKLTQEEVINRFDTGEIFVVLWNTGQLTEHKCWDLLEVVDADR